MSTSLSEANHAERMNRVNLADLFGNRRHDKPCNKKGRFLDSQTGFTLTLEHRKGGGALAQHIGEERILLFRSDRAGAIAKIIYSSNLAIVNQEIDSASQNKVHAKIHVVNVKDQYRRKDLGGLLFAEAISSMKHESVSSGDHQSVNNMALPRSIHCHLEAEEDCSKHNKLVGFYEKLGCHVKPNVKAQYMNNNDGETYRKVPMEIVLPDDSQRRHHLFSHHSLVGKRFLPIQFIGSTGRELTVHFEKSDRDLFWIIVEDDNGCVQFRTTQGHYLVAALNGLYIVSTVDNDDDQKSLATMKPSSNFVLHRVSNSDDTEIYLGELNSDNKACDTGQNDLFIFESSHGTFLSVDSHTNMLCCTSVPIIWQADNYFLSLTCTLNTPAQWQHHRSAWAIQTFEYVTTMRQRYFTFGLARMSFKNALDLIKTVPCTEFNLKPDGITTGSLRTLSYLSAEAARNAGQPDWVQFVALLHLLGGVVNVIEGASNSAFDWTIPSPSRVIGCPAPSQTLWSDFRYLNVDEQKGTYNSKPQGMYHLHCGLDQVLMTWTGPEYMYHLLQQNDVVIPEEGLAMLRYFTLLDWHTHNKYQHLANKNDRDMQPFVTEFNNIRLEAHGNYTMELTDHECVKLWDNHYQYVVSKYCGGDSVNW